VGDPGSIYLVYCPKDCQHSNGSVYGSGIYSDKSSICLAALHQGVITNLGGIVTVKLAWSMLSYEGSPGKYNIVSQMGE